LRVAHALPQSHHLKMTSRVAKMMELAAELRAEERAELADELWSTVPDELSPEWERELRERVDEMNAADARGEAVGEALTFDEMVRRVRGG
jgi:putative addiction module component